MYPLLQELWQEKTKKLGHIGLAGKSQRRLLNFDFKIYNLYNFQNITNRRQSEL